MIEVTKFAVLDIDGTLGPGALGVELLRELMSRDLCDPAPAQTVLSVLGEFAAGHIDFQTMAIRAYAAYARALAHRPWQVVETVARELWSERRDEMFAFVPELLAGLRARGYTPMLISGSPIEMVELVAETLDIPEAHGAVFSRAQDRYTGEVELSSGIPGQKAEIFAAATAGRRFAPEHSFAMGDSLTDVSLFERVGHPLAFEPSPALESLARARGWVIATREDVVARVDAQLGAAVTLQSQAS